MIGESKEYELDVKTDLYGSIIYKSEFYIIDYLKDVVVHCENVYEYFYNEYKDLYIQMLDDDHELYEYIKNTYDCEVYKR